MSIHDEPERETRAGERRPDFSASVHAAQVDQPRTLRSGTPGSLMSQQLLLTLQRCAGNHAVVSLMRDEDETSEESGSEAPAQEAKPISADANFGARVFGGRDPSSGGGLPGPRLSGVAEHLSGVPTIQDWRCHHGKPWRTLLPRYPRNDAAQRHPSTG